MTPSRRAQTRTVRLERIRQLFARTSLKDILDDKFLEGLQKQKHDVESRGLKLVVAQVTLFGLLLLCLAPIQVKVNIFGVEPSSLQQLRELLLVIAVTLNYYLIDLSLESQSIREALQAAINAKAGDDRVLEYVLGLRFSLGGYPGPEVFRPKPDMSPGKTYRLMRLVLRLTRILTFAGLSSFILTIQVWAMIDIYQSPTFDFRISIVIIIYCIMTIFRTALAVELRDILSYRSLQEPTAKDALTSDNRS